MDESTNDLLTREYVFTFVDKITGKKCVVRASDSELATLRAWAKNRNLTFDVNAIDRSEPNKTRRTLWQKIYHSIHNNES